MTRKDVKYVEFIDTNAKIFGTALTYTDIHSTKGIDIANIPIAWNRGFTGKNVKVMIIDSGFTTPSVDIPFEEINSTHIYPANFSGSHGSGVAGIIKSAMNNSGIVGVAYDVKLYGYAFGESHPSNFMADAVEYAILKGINIITMSFIMTGEYVYALDAIFKVAEDAGILCFGSTGNWGRYAEPSFPSKCPSIYGVGACDVSEADVLIPYSGTTYSGPTNNEYCDFLFPYRNRFPQAQEPYYSEVMGTSYSTPAIAGLFAILKEEYKPTKP